MYGCRFRLGLSKLGVGGILLVGVVSGCLADRARPGPADVTDVRLSVQLLTPRSGLTVSTGSDIPVQVLGRDLGSGEGLTGVGFVVRRMSGSTPTLDSAAVRFSGRADTVHTFVIRLPNTLTTNTPVSVFGIAYGAGTQTRLSEPSPLVVVQCINGVCR